MDFVYYANEITSKTIIDKILPKGEQKQIRFIVIPDIINCVEKQTYTRLPLLNTLKSLVDEGLTKIETPHKMYNFHIPIHMGLISAITRSSLYAGQGRYSLFQDLRRMGFLSRMIPFSYQYPIDKIVKIFEYIKGGFKDGKRFKQTKIQTIKTPKKDHIFNPNIELFSQLERISSDLIKYNDGYGIRTQKNLQKLCYANAMLRGVKANDKEVTQEDIDKIVSLSKWMNFEFNEMREVE